MLTTKKLGNLSGFFSTTKFVTTRLPRVPESGREKNNTTKRKYLTQTVYILQ